MTLTEFLLARIAEDEADAQPVDEPVMQGGRLGVITVGGRPAALAISRARVLAECEAKWRIIEVHHPLDDDPEPFCWNCDEEAWPCKTMAVLAAVYADHPDYDEEWRP